MQLAVTLISAQEFVGQVGRIDEQALGSGWWQLGPGEFPIIPVARTWVHVIDCEPDCPDPAFVDPAGRFRFANLASPTRLRFVPPQCGEGEPQCISLQPREVERSSGDRTALGRKWPDLVVDLMQRFMPSVVDAIYVRREGEIPDTVGAAASASNEVVWLTERRGGEADRLGTFIHELMHVYERRLRNVCWHENQEVDGWVLHESWLQVFEEDRWHRERYGIESRELQGQRFSGYRQVNEMLAEFATYYLVPEHLMPALQAAYPREPYMRHDQLEAYAPNRTDWFERMLYGRNLDRRGYLSWFPGATSWPGECDPPKRLGWALERISKLTKIPRQGTAVQKIEPGFKCGNVDLPLM